MQLEQTKIEAYLSHWLGQAVQLERIYELGKPAPDGDSNVKALKAYGYGRPLCIDYRTAQGTQRVVLHQVKPNGFGHERAADRVAEMWQNYNTFSQLRHHVAAHDLVLMTAEGQLESIGHAQDLLLLTDYAPGAPYADDLVRIRDTNLCTDLDLRRASGLGIYLAEIHAVKHADPLLWRRQLRDLIGSGEGIMGLTDSYPPDFALATADDLRTIEEAANQWRWRLKPLTRRLSQVHGDFHPFNILFSQGEIFHLLDRSRGEWGEPANDVSCLAINYLFFALQHQHELAGPFRQLYNAFWEGYLSHTDDPDLCGVIQPWFAWRALVLASPQWYPTLRLEARRKLLTFARRVMAEEHFAWQQINCYLTP